MNVPVEGEVLAGKYRVERILGKGGMGVVVAAMHLQLGQRVAIKFLLENATQETVSRFIREARAAVRLKSEHTARVLDVGDLPDGAPYMVMEYLEGNDLSHLLRSGGALPVADAVLYVLHACEAMAEAHSIGIIHRDLKPANLFLTRGADGAPTIKVLDFGISKLIDEQPDGDEMHLTRTSSLLGSPLYMSPEQLRSAREVTVQSDIWSLGAILYQLLAGQVPFNTRTLSELIMMINIQAPPPMVSLKEGVPPALEAAALRCLEKAPGARFANVGELAWAIAEHGPPEARASAEKAVRTLEAAGVRVDRTTEVSGVHLAPAAPKSAEQRSAPTHSSATLAGASTPVTNSPRSRGPLVIAGVAVGLALTGTAVSLMLRSPSQSPEHSNASAVSVAAPAPAAMETSAAPTAAATPVSASAAPDPTVVAPPPAPPSSASAAAVAGARKPASGAGSPARSPSPPPAVTAAPAPTTTVKSNPLDIKMKF